jgi:4,5-dihydroxyphthalate decarboxylase
VSRLTFACGFYDRTEALRTGDVAVKDVDLDFIAIDSPRDIFDRMGGKQEFAVSEFSSSEYISRFARGDCPFVALPVFPARVFRHGYIYINRKAGISAPKDIAGKRIGVPLYTMTAAVWIRGILAHHHGVDFSGVRWIEGATNHPGRHGEPSAPPLLKPVKIEHDPKGRPLSDLLAAHELDVILGTHHPEPHPDIAPLFADARSVERTFYRQTRIFPIMHLVVIRRDVYERDPWVALSMYKALCKAKEHAYAMLADMGSPKVCAAWLQPLIEEEKEIIGPDWYPYGIEANRPTIEALLQYVHEHGLADRRVKLEELFAPSTLRDIPLSEGQHV